MFDLRTARAVLGVVFAAVAIDAAVAQAPPRPQPTFVRDVTLERGEDGAHGSLLLSNGRIEAVLAPDAPQPAGTRLVEGDGLLCLPAFIDAYSRTGVETPEPVADQDIPVDVGADVRVDMRLANRKGIQPAFRAVEALAIDAKASEAWRENGFGAAHVSPGGLLLAGSGCLAVTREAAMRDLVLVPDAFAHATFAAPGPGYPSTLMGFIAQLRQFFLDAAWHAELTRRHEQGRPGLRPPFDAQLAAGTRILSGERQLLCFAQGHRDVERWLALADELGLRIAIAGGRDAWRVAETLAARDVPVVLTLDWGKEVADPAPEEPDEPEEGEPEEEEPGAQDAPETGSEPATAAETAAGEGAIVAEEDAIVWEYTEPLGVRAERRRRWEERRDCALRLAEAGVRFAFGTDREKPAKLLERVRALVEEGLAPEKALAALTTEAAAIVGAEGRLGRVAPGFDATLTLWSGDPLTEKKAAPVWTFVDGFPTEFEPPDGEGQGPAEGVDVSGEWTLTVETREGETTAELTLKMAEDGSVEGSIAMENPMDRSPMEADVSGSVSGHDLVLDVTLPMGDLDVEATYELAIEGDELSGDATYRIPGMPEPLVRGVRGTRVPQRLH